MFEKIIILLKKLLGFFKVQNQKNEIEHPSSRLSDQPYLEYSAELISNLKGEHQQLVTLYVGIQDLFERQQYQNVVEQLSKFKEDFSLHLMQENVKFYAYLENNLAEESDELQTIKTYRKDMNQIAHVVVRILKKWTTQNSLNESTASEFLQEYKAIGGALVQRIPDEEQHLYTLYR